MCVKVSALLLAIFCCTEIVVIAVTVAVFVDYADYNISAESFPSGLVNNCRESDKALTSLLQPAWAGMVRYCLEIARVLGSLPELRMNKTLIRTVRMKR